jgi:CheY-like chemotaxis protein
MNEPSNATKPPERRRVLFVDDDARFLDVVKQLMGALSNGRWEIVTAESASQAFGILQNQPVDLAVLDVQMGVMDGIQMLSLLNRGYPNVQKAVLTGLRNDQHRATCLSHGAELYLEKPTAQNGWPSLYAALNELLKFRVEEGFRGVLRRVGLQDVIQMECLARNSSVLEIANARVTGQIFIEEGQIIHAQVGDFIGEDAFNNLLAFKGGQFNLKPFTEPPARSISGPWEFLVMEAARKTDEANEATVAAPSGAETLAEAEQILAAGAGETLPAGEGILGEDELPPGTPTRPRVEELLICSAEGEVMHDWQCRNVGAWISFFEFVSQRALRLTQILPLGDFDRLEVQSGNVRAVVIIGADRGVLVKTRREAVIL